MAVKVAILGAGSRGADGYGVFCLSRPDLMKVVALCDINNDRLTTAAKDFGVPNDKCFKSDSEFLAQDKLADVMIIATQDRDHYRHAMAALDKGYDILLEKPISPVLSECVEIANKANELHRRVVVCHVARYMIYFQKIKELIDSKIIGDVVAINQVENVEYWHEAHSFVRGNWRNSNQTSPMILQKTCHDFDLLYWMIGSKCKSVSSLGALRYFKKENQPAGATDYCFGGCKVKKDCPYDCEKIYMDRFKKLDLPPEKKTNLSFYSHIAVNTNEKNLEEALQHGPYGRCVFACDNNVVDHQTVDMEFENGVIANLTMSAFTHDGGRQVKVMGTLGDIVADEWSMTIRLGVYGKPLEIIDVRKLATDFSGHGGGDNKLLEDFFTSLQTGEMEGKCITSIDNSIESHIMALAAEASRLRGGERILLDDKFRMKK